MTSRCRVVNALPGPQRRFHRSRCLRCQAAAARSRAFERELRALRSEIVPAPPGLADAVMARLRTQDSFVPRRTLVLLRVARQAATAAVAAATGIVVATGLIKRKKRLVVSH